jgi:hypothetical protein
MSSKYEKILIWVFNTQWQPGARSVRFGREMILAACDDLGIKQPKNVGDVLYTYRFRREMPWEIAQRAPTDHEWVIEGEGDSLYQFNLVRRNRILPNTSLVEVKVPDSTPQIVIRHALSDEQALLAKVRYNRLLDIFLGMATYSLQSHLRTKVKSVGQVEIDEVYAGVDRHGCQYVIPVQAKGGRDQLSIVQTRQDLRCCEEKFPALLCRPVSAQFFDDSKIALFELTERDGEIRVVQERHYILVAAGALSDAELNAYKRTALALSGFNDT